MHLTANPTPRIPLTGRLTPEQVAEHNRFIAEMREQPDSLQDFVSQPSRFLRREQPAGTTR